MAVLKQRKPVIHNPEKARVVKIPEAATQSFKAGEFVYLASGKATACASDATAISHFALEDASGTTDNEILAVQVSPDLEFEMCVYHSTAGSAVTAITQVGTKYALLVSSNMHYVDIEDETNLAFQVQKLSPKDTVGDQYGRVIVKVLSDICQLGPGEKTA